MFYVYVPSDEGVTDETAVASPRNCFSTHDGYTVFLNQGDQRKDQEQNAEYSAQILKRHKVIIHEGRSAWRSWIFIQIVLNCISQLIDKK